MGDGASIEDQDSLTAELREIEEALAAASTVLYRLNEATARIRTARDWGTYDTWLGGGLFASWIKRERAGEADLALRTVDSNAESPRCAACSTNRVRIWALSSVIR